MLMGIPVSKYASLDLEGIGPLNDAVGGITLTAIETIDKFVKGETITLWGEDAMHYVRSREHYTVSADAGRQARQRQYIEAFIKKAVEKAKSNFSFVQSFYNTAQSYSLTNVTLDEFTYLASSAISSNFVFGDFSTVPGTYSAYGENAAYNINQTGLFELILDIYYK